MAWESDSRPDRGGIAEHSSPPGGATFEAVHRALSASDGRALVRDDWRERNAALEHDLLPEPPSAFLHHPAILYQMFVGERFAERELPRVLAALGDERARLWLREDSVGDPPLLEGHDGSYMTSSNLIHHAHHLIAFRDATGVDAATLGTVVEWGGGYGSLARLVRRLSPGTTYVLIDTPILGAIQWHYLSRVHGEQAVRVVDSPTADVEPGKLNVVPVGLAAGLVPDADLFVSTWGLNESEPAAQRLVVDRDWFGARHLLLGMHDGEWLLHAAAADGARALPLGDFAPGQNYVLR